MRRAATGGPSRQARGLTLIELMVGLAVGLFVSLIAIAVFVSTRTLNVVSNSSARMGENARLAMEALQEDLRLAGFQGCHDAPADPPVSLLDTGAAATVGFLDVGLTGVTGRRGTGVAFAPPFDPGSRLGSLAPPPNTDSDFITVRVPADNLSLGVTAVMAASTAAPQVGASGAVSGRGLRQGDIALIASCKAAAIFQITETDPAATGTLTHIARGGFSPGNASVSLPQRFGKDAAVYRLETRHYYVAPSALHSGTNALWRYRVPCSGCTDNPQELAAGVERLNILWGIDTDGDETVNRYARADAVPAWERVVSARVQMLVATSADNVTQSAQTVAFAGSSVVPTDRRLRTVLTEVIALRNRAP